MINLLGSVDSNNNKKNIDMYNEQIKIDVQHTKKMNIVLKKRFGFFINAFWAERTKSTSSTVSRFNDDLFSFTKTPAALNWRSTPHNVAGIEYNLLANLAKCGK